MSVLKTAWANLQDGLGNRFSWSHVKAIFYNYAEQKLLSTKLDEMDALIDEKIAKAMMSNVQVNDQMKVPTSALAYSMNESITKLNSDFPYKVIRKSIEQSVVQPHGSITITNNLSEYGTYCEAFLCNTYGGPMIYQLNDGGINNHQISLINQADVKVTVGGTILYFIV
mgnify:CR=1 FL=1